MADPQTHRDTDPVNDPASDPASDSGGDGRRTSGAQEPEGGTTSEDPATDT